MYKEIDLGDKKFHYLEFGRDKRDIVLCLHGYADSAGIFSELGKCLNAKYRVLALDFPMIHGPEMIQDIESLTSHVAGFVEALGLRKFTLVGFSLGGLVAVNYAYRDIHRVKELYLLSSSPKLLTSGFESTLYKTFKPLLLSKASCLLHSVLSTNERIRALLKSPPISESVIMRMREYPVSIFGTLANFLNLSLIEEFNSLLIPKTVVLFKDDKILRWERYQHLVKSLDCNLVVFDKGGHAHESAYWENIKDLLV